MLTYFVYGVIVFAVGLFSFVATILPIVVAILIVLWILN